MSGKNYRYIYGPVPSWRLGRSLGIDPISAKEKVCTFDCVYCQLGRTRCLAHERKIFIPTEKVVEELKSLPPLKIDYVTFSGAGEPTLAKNLGEMIEAVKKIRPGNVAVLTNSSLLHDEDVARDLSRADFVACKLDASSQKVFEAVNRPLPDIFKIGDIIAVIKAFRKRYKGKLALQVMFIEDNMIEAEEIARIAGEIRPDEVHLNTPLRPCAVNALSRQEMEKISAYFKGFNAMSVYDARKIKVEPVSSENTMRRRGKVDHA